MTNETESKQRVPPVGAARLLSVDRASVMDRFSDPDLLNEGKVNLIALNVIAERLGDRWPQRRDQIHDHVDRVLQRRLGSQGYHIRISETDFLVCQPELGRFSGQAACLQALREIFTHFFGDAAQADSCVVQVTRFSGNVIEGWQTRASQVEEGVRAELQASAPPTTELRTLDCWTPFVASDGRELKVSSSLEAVMELKSFRRIGFRIRACVMGSGAETLTAGAIRTLSRADISRIDLATFARGMEELRAVTQGSRQPSLIVPVSFTTLSSQRGRAEFAKLLMEARSLVEHGVICEVGALDGIPEGVMLSVVSLIRPYCLFVVAHIDAPLPSAATLRQLKRSGLQAFSVQCPQCPCDTASLQWMKTTIEATRRVVRSTLLYGVASARQAALARQFGATHASVTE